MHCVRVGVSGWTYRAWRGPYYPAGLRQADELPYVAARMNSAEVNGSFYALQRPESYRRWREATPAGFVFAVKGPRFITHMKKLREVREPLANFLASGVLLLGEKLGPLLWQFPARQAFERERFEDFLALLPRGTIAAAAVAAGHSERLAGRAWTEALAAAPLRHAFEVRHPSFFDGEFSRLLAAHGAGLVLADTAGKWPYCEDVTADFVYLRLHGAERLYWSGYSDEQLAWWAARIRDWSAGREPPDARTTRGKPAGSGAPRDVFAYFDNDAQAHAPRDAERLLALLRQNAS
ncbi:MAG TPA: DUF72 domain-containing protein [Deinococcales bacterium]|nr:DUF72 domain-containing protein [Deinococcales bacterium]